MFPMQRASSPSRSTTLEVGDAAVCGQAQSPENASQLLGLGVTAFDRFGGALLGGSVDDHGVHLRNSSLREPPRGNRRCRISWWERLTRPHHLRMALPQQGSMPIKESTHWRGFAVSRRFSAHTEPQFGRRTASFRAHRYCREAAEFVYCPPGGAFCASCGPIECLDLQGG
jgi:hypothetical protein